MSSVKPSVYRAVVGWRHVMESLLTVGPKLSDVQWGAPTECPDWTVKDVYAHVIGGERWMAEGHPGPAADFAEWVSAPVAARRDTPAPLVLEELRRVYEQRRVQLDSGGIDPDGPAYLATGQETTLGRLLEVRVFDLWAHEQDVRRAVGMPGNLDSPAAAVAGQLCVAALPRVVARAAGVPAGTAVRLSTTGEVTMDVAVAVDADGRGALVSPDRSVAAHLTLSWEAYTRLSCGRGARSDYDVKIIGDRALAEKILAHLTITP
jgi:uncharacterized protein (TIGR03083 family)